VKNHRATVLFVVASEAELSERSEASPAFCTFAKVLTCIFLIICPFLYPA
jgi:hypothetical protein